MSHPNLFQRLQPPFLSNTHARARHISTRQACATSAAAKPDQPVIIVTALGGNALLQRGQPLTMEAQTANARLAARALASLADNNDVRLCITHGNGPQVGLLAEQDPTTPLDVLGAESEGQIGYVVELELQSVLPHRSLCALLTKTVVDPADPAFLDPTKFIGPVYSHEEAAQLEAAKGWVMKQDGRHGWRRVVASPAPVAIQEAGAVALLLRENIITVCCGGGGIPVAQDPATSTWHGIEAVVDKDAASALLAIELGAHTLLLLTDADAVYDPEAWALGQRLPLPSPIPASTVASMAFAAGSMGPKVAAAVAFVEHTGGVAGIGSLKDASAILDGRAGTRIVPG